MTLPPSSTYPYGLETPWGKDGNFGWPQTCWETS